MELVEGQSLAQVLDDLRGERSSSSMEASVTQVAAGTSDTPEAESTGGAESTSHSGTGGRRWFDTVAGLLADVGDALHYAHEQGVIHRDVKPANLLLSGDGRLCLGDFGLARVTQEPGMTVSGSFLGTPAYMSPEQVAAGRVKLDHRTDVYLAGGGAVRDAHAATSFRGRFAGAGPERDPVPGSEAAAQNQPQEFHWISRRSVSRRWRRTRTGATRRPGKMAADLKRQFLAA